VSRHCGRCRSEYGSNNGGGSRRKCSCSNSGEYCCSGYCSGQCGSCGSCGSRSCRSRADTYAFYAGAEPAQTRFAAQ